MPPPGGQDHQEDADATQQLAHRSHVLISVDAREDGLGAAVHGGLPCKAHQDTEARHDVLHLNIHTYIYYNTIYNK